MSLDGPLADSLAHAFGADVRVSRLDDLVGDASTRLYQRAHLEGAPLATVVVMRLPPDALTRSDEAAKASKGDELPFSNMLRAAASRGIRVPKLHADLTRAGNFTVLLEDLGDATLYNVLHRISREAWVPRYRAAVDLLVHWQRAFAAPDPSCVAFGRRFDRELLRWELDHFLEWGLEALRGPIEPAARTALGAEFDALVDEIAAMDTTLVHRDWQSKNLMVLADGSLAVIDFQDALVGPRPYDLVALLCDSYTSLSGDEQTTLISHYLDANGLAERDAFRTAFFTQAVQRKLKDAGRFVFIDRVRKNPNFLQYIPQSVRYVHRALLQLPKRRRLHALLAERAPEWFGDGAPK